jgi:hypothetical protein
LIARSDEPHRGRDERGVKNKRKEHHMSNDKTTKAAPTHRVFSVSKKGEKKPTWTEIGAAWPHKDGQGFNLTFTARPLEGAEIVLRVAKKAAAKSKTKPSRGTLDRYDEPNNAGDGAQ